jgi:hypothetical protein
MVRVSMKDKKVGFASWFDDMNKGCTCVGYFEQFKLQVEQCNNEHSDFVTIFEEASYIHSFNVIESQIK